mmetsp:Transcript_25120/g.99068  ORF Transcript_25120/g.99068 Transcript_25120/m.99068 type:complete len:202 (+) Transcript_25120:849-1454(+)
MRESTRMRSHSRRGSSSLRTRWNTTRSSPKCTLETTSRLISTDGSSPSMIMLELVRGRSSTRTPLSSTRQPSVTGLRSDWLEESSSRSKPIRFQSTRGRAEYLDGSPSLGMRRVTSRSARAKASTSLRRAEEWLQKRLLSCRKMARFYQLSSRSRTLTFEIGTTSTGQPTRCWISCKPFSIETTVHERPLSNSARMSMCRR